MDNQGRPRGFAHITFTDESAAITAVNSAAQEPLHIAGRDLSLDFASNTKRANAPPPPPNNKVYFANFEGGENGLRTLFKDYESNILSVFLRKFLSAIFFRTQVADIIFIVRDGNTGAALPSGFVEFSDVDVATSVIDEFNGMALPSGANLEINYARPKKPRQENNRFDSGRYDNRRADNKRGNHYTNRGYNSQRNYE